MTDSICEIWPLMIYVSNIRTYNLQEESNFHKGHVSILHGHPWYLILPSPLQLPNLSPYSRFINAKMWKHKKYENKIKVLTLSVSIAHRDLMHLH